MHRQTTKSSEAPAAGIFLLPALGLFVYLFHPLFWSSVIDNDMTTYFYYFYKKLFFSELSNGEVPLWNPGVALGYYQAGNPLHSYFYPLNVIFFLLPFDLAYNWLILIHFFLAGFFMYLLVRALTGNIPASVFAGITYAFSGVMISLSKNIGFLFGAVWYPLILFSLEKYLNESMLHHPLPHPPPSKGRETQLSPHNKSPLPRGEGIEGRAKGSKAGRYFALLTLAFSCQFLTGDLQSFVIGVGLALVQVAVRSHQREPILRAPARFALSFGRAGLFLAGSLALALGISMIQLLPLLDMAGQSYRLEGIPLEEAGYFSLNPQRLLNLFHPFLWGRSSLNTFWGDNLSNSLTMKQFWYPSIYLGIAPIFLALCSLLRNKQISPSPSPSPLKGEGNVIASPSPQSLDSARGNSSIVNRQSSITRGLAISYFILIVVFFFLACGSFTPVWPWIYSHLPGFSLFRFPAKYFSVVNLFLCTLAGLGLANLLFPNPDDHPLPHPPPSRGRGGKLIPLIHRDEKIIFIGIVCLAAAVLLILLLKYSSFQAEIASHPGLNTIRALSELRQGCLLLALFSAASGLIIFLLARFQTGKNYLLFALFLLLGIDLFLGLTPLKVADRADFRRAPEAYSRILAGEEPHSFRLWVDPGAVPFFRTGSYREALVPNAALDYRVDYFFGNEPALPGRNYEFYRFDNLGNLADLLPLADTKYILTNIRQSGKPVAEIYPRLAGLQPVFADPDRNILLFRNENARPRLHPVSRWEWVPSGREAFQRMVSPGSDPGNSALLEGNECLKSGKVEKMEACRDRLIFANAGNVGEPFNGLPSRAAGEGRPYEKIKVIRYTPNRVDLETSLPASGLFIFNDSYYPGWRAQVDGKDKEIYRTNYLFKGIFLSGGEHRVSFIFNPASYRWGKWITIFSLCFYLLAVILMKSIGRLRKATPHRA